MKLFIYLFLVISVCFVSNSTCQNKNKNVNKNMFTGLFSDCNVDPESGDATGTGELTIVQKNGKYAGSFIQHYGTEGGTYKKVALTDLLINENDKTISFKTKWFESEDPKHPRSKDISVTGLFNKKGVNLKITGAYNDPFEVFYSR